jgi:hypothetical protein
MNDEQALLRKRDEGSKAKTVLDSEAFQNAFNGVRNAIVDTWKECPIRDRDGAHELRLMLKLMNDIEGHLKKAVADGQFSAKELERDKTIGQRIADRLRIA